MSKQMLIYDQVVPVSKEKHKDWCVKQVPDFSFCQNINAVPVVLSEIPPATSDYVIVFVESAGEVMPFVLLGVENDNLFVDEQQQWKVDFVPAFIRRYPFTFAKNEEEPGSFTLCCDETFHGWNQEGIGERLFDTQQEQTQYLKNLLSFLQTYQEQFQLTQLFGKKLKDWNLLEPAQANFDIKGEKTKQLSGFLKVNREQIGKLSDEQLLEIARTRELEFIYLHLHSLANVSKLSGWAKLNTA